MEGTVEKGQLKGRTKVISDLKEGNGYEGVKRIAQEEANGKEATKDMQPQKTYDDADDLSYNT